MSPEIKKEKADAKPVAKKPRWRRRLLWFVLTPLVVIVLLVFLGIQYVSSERFLRSFVLPRVEKATGRNVELGSADVRLFRGVVLEDLTIGPKSGEKEPLLESDRLIVQWRVWPLLRRRVHVTFLAAHNLQVVAIQAPESAAPPSGEASAPKPAKESKSPKTKSSPWAFQIDEVSVTSSAITLLQPYADPASGTARYSIRNLEIKGKNLALGEPIRLDLSARVDGENPAEKTRLTDGRITLALNSEVKPGGNAYTVDGSWAVDHFKGQFRGLEAADLRATGTIALEQENRDRLLIRHADSAVFYKGKPSAAVDVSGELNPRTTDGSLTVKLRGVDRNFLNLLSTPNQPLDFADTKGEALLRIERSQRGSRLALDGDMQLRDFSVAAGAAPSKALPPSQVTLLYKTSFEQKPQRLTIEQLKARADQKDRNVVLVDLTSPMRFTLGEGGEVAADSPASLTVSIDRFDLAWLGPFLPQKDVQVQTGQLSVDSALRVGAAGSVNAKGSLKLAGLQASAGGRDLGRTDGNAVYDLAFDKDRFAIRQLDFQALKDGKPAGRIEGRGEISLDGREGRLDLTGQGIDLAALQVFLSDLPGVRLSGGIVDFKQTLAASGEKQPMQFTGQLDAKALAFALPDQPRAQFANWQVRIENQVAIDPAGESLRIDKLALNAGEATAGSIGASATGRLAMQKGSGTLDVTVNEAAAPLLASILDRFGDKPEAGLKATAGSLSGNARLAFEKSFSQLNAKGGLKTSGLKWVMKDKASATEMAGDLESAFDVALLSEPSRLEIRDTTLKVATGGKAGGSLQVAGNMNLTNTSGELDLQFDKFDTVPALAIAGPLLGDWRVMGGTVDGRQKIRLGDNLAQISAQGRLRVDRLAFIPPGASQPIRPDSLDLETDLTLTGPADAIEFKPFLLRQMTGDKETGLLDLRGRLDLKGKKTAMTVKANRFDSAPVWPLLRAMGTAVPVTAAHLSGTQDVTYSFADSAIQAKGNLRIDNLSIQRGEGEPPIPMNRLDLTDDLSLAKDKTDVRQLVLSTYSKDQMLDRIELTASGGGLDSKEKMDVTLKSPNLHLDHYLSLLPQSKESEKTTAAAKPAPRPAAGGAPAQDSQGFKIPGPPINATVDLGEFHYDRYHATDVDARLGVTDQGVTIYGLTAKLTDGAASATGWLRTDVAKPAFDATIGGSGLDVASLMAMFAPAMKDKLSGTGGMQFRVTGMGLESADLRQSLKCNGAFRIDDGRWKETPILNALASVTQVQNLSDVRFFRFDGRLRVERGVVYVDDASLIGDLQKLRAKGTIGFDTNVDLQFDLWLGGQLAERLKDQKYFKYLKVESDRYLRLPIPIGMAGTLSKPRPTLKLPTDAILDIGIDQGLRALDEYLKKRQND